MQRVRVRPRSYRWRVISVDYQHAELLFSRFELRATLEATREAAVKDAEAAPVDGATSDLALDQMVATLAHKHSIDAGWT